MHPVAALQESGIGPSRPSTDAQQLGRFWNETDIRPTFYEYVP
jgi:hypothetical protein